MLVDETSASASEIFAAAIQDYKRGIIIGSTSSYGKGTVQRTIPLNPEGENILVATKKSDDLGSLKITLQKFYRINGDATQMKGVVPDVVLPDRLEYLKFREKDNPYALKWDEIGKADYTLWTGSSDLNSAIDNARKETANNPNFNKIKTSVQWLQKNADREYSLNMKQFETDQKQMKTVFKQIEEAYKLPKALDVKNIAADTTEVNRTKEKADRNKQFVKRVGDDIYIDQSVKILNKMIVNDNLAKKN